MRDEVPQQLELARRQVDRRARARHLHLPEIDGDVAEPIGVAAGCGARRRAPQQRLEPRHQLDRLERLRQVVVGAQLQADHLVHHLPSRRQHQNRRRHAALTHLAADVEAVHPRQHHVEHDEIVAAARPPAPGPPRRRSRSRRRSPRCRDDRSASAAGRPRLRRAARAAATLTTPRPAAAGRRSRGSRRRTRRSAARSSRSCPRRRGCSTRTSPPCDCDDVPDDAQPDAAAAHLRVDGAAAAEERLEDVRQIGRRRCRCRDPRRECCTAPPSTHVDRDLDAASRRAVLDRVADHVLHGGPQRVGVARPSPAASPCGCTVMPTPRSRASALHAVHRVGDHLRDVDVGADLGLLAGVDAGELAARARPCRRAGALRSRSAIRRS